MISQQLQQLELAVVTKEELKQNHIDNIFYAMCDNKEAIHFYKKCGDCGSEFQTVKTKKGSRPKLITKTCGINYCNNRHCVLQRIMVAQEYFNVFLSDLDLNNKAQLWRHGVLGFPRISKDELTKEYQSQCLKKVRKFLHFIKKNHLKTIRVVYVKDLSYDEIKKGKEYYLHFHLAIRPLKKLSDTELNIIGSKFGLKWNRKKISTSNALKKYFANRFAGQFQHKQDENDWVYARHFTLEEYYDKFHGTKKQFNFGYSKAELKFLRSRYKQILLEKCEALLTCKEYQSLNSKYCESCGSEDFTWERYHIPSEDLPPDERDCNKMDKIEYVYLGGTRC